MPATLERLALSRAIDEKSKKIRLLKREVEAIELKVRTLFVY